VYEPGERFTIGKGKLLRDGGDLTIFASGIMVAEALTAADILAERGVSARVVDLFTWKPIDTELITRCAAETKRFIVAENHNVYGGLGSAVAEVTAKTCPVPIQFVGVDDQFGQVGTQAELQKAYNLTAAAIVVAALQ
ncbi:MAG: transketolase family protein, partial [Oscillospiraceae bacterium]|jgi:transketolase|nr:transketolase family protein [Oscillospiraceae bacterium]